MDLNLLCSGLSRQVLRLRLRQHRQRLYERRALRQTRLPLPLHMNHIMERDLQPLPSALTACRGSHKNHMP